MIRQNGTGEGVSGGDFGDRIDRSGGRGFGPEWRMEKQDQDWKPQASDLPPLIQRSPYLSLHWSYRLTTRCVKALVFATRKDRRYRRLGRSAAKTCGHG